MKGFLKGVALGAVTSTLVLAAGTALAGSGIGAVFNLGRTNRVNAQSTLKGATKGKTLQLTNTGSGRALGLNVRKGKPPLAVNSAVRVANLNADKVDGKHASAFALDYCALVKGHPRSYPPGPCQGVAGTVDTGGDVGQYTSTAIGADGLPVVSYHDDSNGDLRVAHCGNVACSSGNTTTAVDTAGDVGRFTSTAIGTDGLPVVSYYDDTNDDLKVAHCGNASCSSGNTLTPVDTAGDVGSDTSIAIGTDGLPVVSYRDETNFDLKVAHCGNASCSAGNTLRAVDTAGNVGAFTSIAIGTDGLPVVSYLDGLNFDLKVARPPVP